MHVTQVDLGNSNFGQMSKILGLRLRMLVLDLSLLLCAACACISRNFPIPRLSQVSLIWVSAHARDMFGPGRNRVISLLDEMVVAETASISIYPEKPVGRRPIARCA